MDSISSITSSLLTGSSDDNIARIGLNDFVPIDISGGEPPLSVVKSPGSPLIAGSAEKCPKPDTASVNKSSGKDSKRPQRVTPALMNAMALYYQTYFEGFCKGKINKNCIVMLKGRLQRRSGVLIRNFQTKSGRK